MKTGVARTVACIFTALLMAACARMAPQETLAGTHWRLVKFQGGDGTVRVPDDPSKYTLGFGPDGKFTVRFDCNRGFGGWSSPEKNRVEFGAMGLTRALCPPESLHDQLVKHWPFVRSYVMKDGNLYLSLMADGGSYEFERIR